MAAGPAASGRSACHAELIGWRGGTESRAPLRLAYVVSHPIQYQAPLLRQLAEDGEVDVTVLFLSDLSTRATATGLWDEVESDVPLLEGYRHWFLPAWG